MIHPCAYLFSVHPEYAYRIMSGVKKFEYRRFQAREHLAIMFIYATSPISMIIGEVAVDDIICDTPMRIWGRTEKNSGLRHEDFFDYFKGKDVAYAYCLSTPRHYSEYVPLVRVGIISPPQSFVYISEQQVKQIREDLH